MGIFSGGSGSGSGQGSTDGWLTTTDTWTYASASTFTIGADRTAIITPGTRLQLTQTTAKYFVVASSSFGGGNTTVTVQGGSDYSLANAAITSPKYSYAVNPQGYPGWFNFAPAFTGLTSITTSVARFSTVGRQCTFYLYVQGTSNAAAKTFTAPFTSANFATMSYRSAVAIEDNGAVLTPPGQIFLLNNSASANVYKDMTQTNFTASGQWLVSGTFVYEF